MQMNAYRWFLSKMALNTLKASILLHGKMLVTIERMQNRTHQNQKFIKATIVWAC